MYARIDAGDAAVARQQARIDAGDAEVARQKDLIAEMLRRIAVLEASLVQSAPAAGSSSAPALPQLTPAPNLGQQPQQVPRRPAQPQPPQAQPQPAQPQPPSGIIMQEWMLNPRPSPLPPLQDRCQHGALEWFCLESDWEIQAYDCFKSADNIPLDIWTGRDALNQVCQGATDSWDLPYLGQETLLYAHLRAHPSLFIDYHMPSSSGAYYVRCGCSNCHLMTCQYQPQYENHKHHLNLAAKDLKQHPFIRNAFRAFLSKVLDIEIEKSPCRFRTGEIQPQAIADGSV